MKVVLFCGGLGTRLREYSETIPKPMVNIGARPIIWHLMKYYAHFGHTEFILCLGYRGDLIKNYFLNYDECLSNDFVLSDGGRTVRVYNRDIDDWTITFADTGVQSNIGQRLQSVEKYLTGEEMFLANYSDGLSDLYLPEYVSAFERSGKVASMLCVQPRQSFHEVITDSSALVKDVRPISQSGMWINGGFFAFRQRIFDYLKAGQELTEEPFTRLIQDQELVGHQHHGFWGCIDTFKDKQLFDEMELRGDTPWRVWREPDSGLGREPSERPPRVLPPSESRIRRLGADASP